MKKLLLPLKILVARIYKFSEIWKHKVIKTKGETREAGKDDKQNYPEHPWFIMRNYLFWSFAHLKHLYPVSNLENQINNHKRPNFICGKL